MIDWGKTALENYNWIRALTKPYPGAFTITNFWRIKLWESKMLKTKTLKPGVFEITREGLIFGCSDNDLLITDYEIYNNDYTF